MIAFFRTIRKNLVDDNKPLKYLRYAFGEIILVVIGILIALQINNWNEKRKQNNERILYQKSLHDDRVLDTLMIIEGNASYQKQLASIDSIFSRLYGKDGTIDTLKIIVQNEYRPGLTSIRNLNSSTFNAMESSGKLDLFKTDLKTAILKHYLMQKSALQLLNITVNANLEQTLDFGKKYPFQLGGDNYMSRIAWTDINERDFVIGFNRVIGYHLHALQLNLKTCHELLNGTRELIRVLNVNR